MNKRIYRFYEFMTGCGGNWRNSIFISCPACSGYCSTKNRGCLLTTDRDGRPMVLSVTCFEEFSGENIDTFECAGHISKDAFEALYARYLYWELDDSVRCQLCAISHESQNQPMLIRISPKE